MYFDENRPKVLEGIQTHKNPCHFYLMKIRKITQNQEQCCCMGDGTSLPMDIC